MKRLLGNIFGIGFPVMLLAGAVYFFHQAAFNKHSSPFEFIIGLFYLYAGSECVGDLIARHRRIGK